MRQGRSDRRWGERAETNGRSFSLARRGTAEALMRAVVGIVDQAEFDLSSKVLSGEGAQQPQPERVLQCLPESLDQGDRAFLADRSEALLHP